MRRVLRTIGLGLVLTAGIAAAEDLSAWGHRATLVFSGYSGAGALTNFPALVRLSEGAGGFSYAECKADGGDIRFSLHNGDALSHEISSWNPAGVSEFWVRIPVLVGTNTAIAVHWGNDAASAPAPEDVRKTWASDYVGVWHFDDGPTLIRDATDYANHGSGYLVAPGLDGIVGPGREFDSNRVCQVYCGYDASLRPSTFTYEAWFKLTNSPADRRVLMGQYIDYNKGSYIGFDSGKPTLRVTNQYASAAAAATLDTWHHMVGTYGGGKGILYVDGAKAAEVTTAFAIYYRPLCLGHAFNSSSVKTFYFHEGSMDELRFSSRARSADYAKAVFMNIASNSLFQSFTQAPAGTLTIAETLSTPATLTPARGVTSGWSAGAPIDCSAPVSCDDATTGARYTCLGYTVYADGTLADSGSGTNYSGTYPAGVRTVTVTWRWARSYQMTFSAGANGSVSPSGAAWYPEGTNVTVTATPDDPASYSFYSWSGNCPTTKIFDAEVTLPADRSWALAAGFGRNYYVSTNGSDANDGLSLAAPKLTIQAAVDAASAGDTVRISDGTYTFTNGSYGVTIAKSIAVRSINGLGAVTLDANYGRAVLSLNGSGALVHGLTLIRGASAGWNLPSCILVTMGHVQNCLLSANRGTSANNDAIQLNAGWVSRCTVRNGTTTAASAGRNTAIGVLNAPSVVEYCVLSNNVQRKSGQIGAALYVVPEITVVRNCLIVSNTSLDTAAATAIGGGVRMIAGRLENCTIADNQVNGFGGGAYVSGLTLCLNNVVAGNSATAGGSDITGTNRFVYSCSPDLPDGLEGNVSADPRYADAAAFDYRLSGVSPAIDGGFGLPWTDDSIADDLAGTSRVINAVVDMGAYEYAPTGTVALQCGFTALPASGLLSVTPTFTATVLGDTNGLIYTWVFGDGASTSGPNLGVVTHTYGPGYYTVSLSVTNAADEGFTVTDVDAIQVIPQVAYAATNGSHIAPFLSWPTAATNVESAIAVGSPEVEVAAGVFEMPTGAGIALRRAVRVRGAGPSLTILDAKGKQDSRVWMTSPAAVLEGLTCRNGNADWNLAGAIDLEEGTVSNCVISSAFNRNGGAINLRNGRVVGCTVRNGTGLTGSGSGGSACGIYITGTGTVERTIVSNNVCSYYTAVGAGIRSGFGSSALIRNCLIVNNRNVPTGTNAVAGGAGVYLAASGTVENCTITENRTGGSGGGLYVSGGAGASVLRNNIIYGNLATNSWYAMPKSDIGDAGVGTVFSNSCSPDLTAGVNGNITDDPQFYAPAAGDYQIRATSPCRDRGLNLDWMANATDLAGAQRRVGRADMGAYEVQSPPGLVVFLQ